MASKNNIQELKKKIVPILKRNNVKRAGIFGSYARGEAKKDSDIDMIVAFSKRKSLLDIVRIERELSEGIGKKVDLLTKSSISPYIIDKIKKETVVIHK